MVDLSVKIGRLNLKNPVMVASGTFGEEHTKLIDIDRLGAVVTKTITLKARVGNPPPRIVETPSGMLNSIGLENGGLEHLLKEKLPFYDHYNVPVIVSIAGDDKEEFSELASRLSESGRVSAIELNLSCPNVKHGKRNYLIAQDESESYEIVSAVRKVYAPTIIAKLSPNVTDITKIVSACESAGADAVMMVNTFLGMAVDIDSARPVLGNVMGGLSGPAIKPLALRMVYQASRKTVLPIIGAGGISSPEDALEFLLCGATAVQVGTANFVDPRTAIKVKEGIERYMKARKIKNMNGLIGGLHCEDKLKG